MSIHSALMADAGREPDLRGYPAFRGIISPL
jgi:hypothetical protein